MSKRVDRANLREFAEYLKTNANILKRNTAYNVDEIINKGQVVLKCVTAGTTDKDELNLTNIALGDTLTDGSAEWEVVSTTGYGFGNGGGTSVSEWATATSYEAGQIVIYGDSLYRCNTDHDSTTFSADESNWTLIYSDLKDWATSIYYKVGVVVVNNSRIYKCITAHTSSTFNTDIANWEQIGGTDNISVNNWATSTAYKAGNIVINNGSIFRCTTNHTSTTFDSDIANWELVYSDTKDWEQATYYVEGATVINDNKLYKCITSHLSTTTFDGSKWQIIGDYITAPVKIGEVGFVSWQYTLMANHLALDGGTVSNFQVTYPELYDFFDNNNLLTTVQADYDANKALCLYDSSTDTATMPDFLDKTVWGSNTIEEKSAGLPNIKGSNGDVRGYSYKNYNTISGQGALYGFASQYTTAGVGTSTSGDANRLTPLYFDASRYNSIYSDSINTVQPPAIGLIPQIRYTKDSIEGTLEVYDRTPIGTVISYMGNTPPKDYLSCDGTVYQITQYQALADFINTQFGSHNYFGGDGTSTFAVPDLRGEFLRGTGTNSHTNQGNGDNVGTHQDATSTPNVGGNNGYAGGYSGYIYTDVTGQEFSVRNPDSDSVTDGVSGYVVVLQSSGHGSNEATGYTTSRPTNTSVLYCIKYKNSNPPEAIDDWITAVEYEDGDFVIKDNQIYRCNTAHISTTFSADIANWDMISGLQVWTASTTYKANSLVYHGGKLYKVTTDFTSTSTFETTNLELVGGGLSEWEASTTYQANDILVYDGEIYKSLVGFTSGNIFENIEILEDYTLQTGDTPITWANGVDITTGDIVEYNSEYFVAKADFKCGDTFTKVALEEYVPKPLTDQQIEDIIRNFNPVQSGSTGFVVQNSAPAHNALYRGKDLTDYFNSGEMSIAIANGSFEDIFPGDYVIKSVTVNGTTYADTKWIVGDCNYFLHNGDTECVTNHVLVFPEVCIGTSYMNSSNTTANGYVGSYMWSTRIPQYVTGIQNAFGSSHVLSHRELLTTAMTSNNKSSAYPSWDGAASNWVI